MAARIIGRAIIRAGGRQIVKHVIRETKFWRGLYGPSGRFPGVSNYKQAAKGVQHGLFAGSVAGSFIGEESGSGPSGQILIDTPYSKNKTRSGYSNRRSGRYNRYKQSCSCRRRSNSRFNKKGSYRFKNKRYVSYRGMRR